MLQIKEKDNIILCEAEEAKRQGRKIYIYGAAWAGESVFKALSEYHIVPDGFCVDPEYYREDFCFCGIPVISSDDILDKEDCTIIVACASKKYIWKDFSNIETIDRDFISLVDMMRIDFAYVNKHMDMLTKLYNELCDEESRKCMEAFLNQRISGKFEYQANIWKENQYYDQIVMLKNVSCMVDCGAYDGDTFRSFCRYYEQETGKGYEGKAYLLEPDEHSYQKLEKHYKDKQSIATIKAGAWDKKDQLYFDVNEYSHTSSTVSELGGVSIQVDAIDNIISSQAKVDFIKMDIEGSELNALKGAENTIRKDHPILAICVYHRSEDLITIPQYIKSLNSKYKLYLRVHDWHCRELVLYALPY